jgi:hypothetical protein
MACMSPRNLDLHPLVRGVGEPERARTPLSPGSGVARHAPSDRRWSAGRRRRTGFHGQASEMMTRPPRRFARTERKKRPGVDGPVQERVVGLGCGVGPARSVNRPTPPVGL